MGWFKNLTSKKADWWFGENSLYDQLTPDNFNISLPGGVGIGFEKESVSDIVNVTNTNTQTGFDIQEFINDPMVRQYGPYVLAYLILKR